MNRASWMGVIGWGVLATALGFAMAGSAAPQDVVFLLAGGSISCLVGAIGLGLRVPRETFH
ncbi:MAG: hypothetical protein V4508_10520 [Pseudomonadota bacterium]